LELLDLKELSRRSSGLTSGHRACAGCGVPVIVRIVLASSDWPLVVVASTGCLEVFSTIYPYTSWPVPWMHSAFENAAATISGIETAYRCFRKKGKMEKEIRFVAFAGDGGTYDIGLQSLSGACERGHRFLYVCYNNEAYMNTGIQRSSATPLGAKTTTTPRGKAEWRKDLTEIMVAHQIPYVAQASISFYGDLIRKVRKALSSDGPSFINVLAPCPTGWGYPTEKMVEVDRLAVETRYWPLYEVENGKYRINYKPRERIEVVEWLKIQDRFKHLIEDEETIKEIQMRVDRNWERLLLLERHL